ncbi:MAG TPA: sulfotransferase [Rudaea sp.]|nr:sulfotransferase [Rudaea sp.]
MAAAHETNAATSAASRLAGLPPAAVKTVVAAAQALELGQADTAERLVVGLLALHADHPELLRLLSGVQTLRGQAEAAVATMQRAAAARPGDALYRNTLGSALIAAGRYDEAIAVLREACALDPELATAWFNLGLVCMRSMRVAESAAALRKAVELAPTQWNARVILGDMLRAEGRLDDAIAEYRRVLAQEPRAGMAWWGLAEVKTRRMSDEDIARLREAMQRPGTSDADLVAMGFALAKALDDQAQLAESLHALGEAHARARRHARWDARAHAGAVDAVLAAFTPPIVGAHDATLGSDVIFIVSLPRSASTLTEQVLASHSLVEGAGELPDLPAVLTEESQRRRERFPQWAAAATPDDWTRLGRRYLERTAHWRERRPRFTDKLPYNWFYVGAIRAMLPGARIVVGRRDPLETCFACYRQYLALNEYTRTFSDLAAFWRDFDRAVRHWRALHPAHVRENVYEELVAEPEANIRALLDFCGLPFEPGCLEFHASTREVHTPSATQVREPLRRDTARSERYGALLDPLRAALGLPAYVPAR